MALVLKTNPVGIDVRIAGLQSYLYSKINVNSDPITNPLPGGNDLVWNSYHRANMNPVKGNLGKFIAEVSNSQGDYDYVYLDDRVNTASFFIVKNRTGGESKVWTADVSMIVQSVISDIYPSIPHRADEEILTTFTSVLDDVSGLYPLTSIDTEIDDVYREFDQDKLKLDNISSFHVMRFNFEIPYDVNKIEC